MECEWYFTVMAAMINRKEVGSLFASKDCYRIVDLLTGYNSQNWLPHAVEVARRF